MESNSSFARMENQTGRSQPQYDQRAATEAAQHFMSLIARVIPGESTRQGQSQVQQSGPRPTVEHEMARSFPGFFKSSGKIKRHFAKSQRPAVLAKTRKTFDLSLSLLCCKSDMTPSISEELELMQAGLGKRTLSVASDITHAELSSLLQETYSKMNDLQDRWLLFKAAGGNGRRRISAIPLESEGYTGSVIKSASNSGRNLLYIVPLQDELDMTPLPPDAPEFAKMPKATCKKCQTVMPLQTLALHVDQCDSVQNSEIEEEDVVFVEEATLSPSHRPSRDATLCNVTQNIQKTHDEAQCPICTDTFPVSELEFHASFCGESLDGEPEKLQNSDLDHTLHLMVTYPTSDHCFSLM
ncbi:uncharacterized protein [Misgurnus anguillicaudatus]|uniref:uncharacterized protein n=1 Tax=Misgurnus anguillicaudatus TaxID=75329 RepID=UPI003CCF80C1